jgi:hypothetical protein
LRDEAAGDDDFGRSGGGEGTEELVIFGTDGGGGVAVRDFVGRLAGLIVGELGGVVAIVGDEDAFDAVEDEEPGLGLEIVQEFFGEFGSFELVEGFGFSAGDVSEGVAAEVGHLGTAFVEGIPEAAGEVGADCRGVLIEPVPGEHTFAGAADGVEEDDGVGVGGDGPVIEGIELGLAADELVGGEIGGAGMGSFCDDFCSVSAALDSASGFSRDLIYGRMSDREVSAFVLNSSKELNTA